MLWAAYSVLNRRHAQVPSAAITVACLAVAVLGALVHFGFERSVADMGPAGGDDRCISDLTASIRVQRDRLAEMRRAGAELSAETVQSFSAGLDTLGARIGREARKAA